MENDNILDSVKDCCNVSEAETDFDNELLMHINNAFVILSNIGVGSEIPFIVDSETGWSDFDVSSESLPMIKMYVYLRVRSLFDSPQSSSLNTAMKESLAEFEWRLNLIEDHSFEASDES